MPIPAVIVRRKSVMITIQINRRLALSNPTTKQENAIKQTFQMILSGFCSRLRVDFVGANQLDRVNLSTGANW